MKVRCPHCQVIYNIPSAALEKAAGQVVCSECHNIFRTAPEKKTHATPAAEPPARKPAPPAAPDDEMRDLLSDLERSLEQQSQNIPQNLPDTEFLAELDPAAESSLLPDTQPLEEPLPPESTTQETQTEGTAPSEASDDSPDEPFAPELPGYRKKISASMILLIVFLGLAALAQLAWLQKEQLLEQPQLRRLAEQICPYFDCQLPRPSRAQAFHVLDRLFEPYPSHPGAYRLNLLLRNDSSTAQPPPALQLSLLDQAQQVMARRTIPASIYLSAQPSKNTSLGPGKTLEVHLLLVPPHPNISGFELDLLPTGS
ncbi:zinc-ribbon and DUF3426 domain-containing protein [Thiolapillus sp.]